VRAVLSGDLSLRSSTTTGLVDLDAAALGHLASEPTLTEADLGRRLNISTRSGHRLKLNLATAVT